jgi:hypothetical protein
MGISKFTRRHWQILLFSLLTTIRHVYCPKPGNESSAVIPAKFSLVSKQFINYGFANYMGLPMHLSLQTKGGLTSS